MSNKFPKKKYEFFDTFFSDYNQNLSNTVNSISNKKLNSFLVSIEKAIKSNSNIFICGNGGSSSVANHFLCDFQKGLLLDNKLKLRTQSLTSNTDLITAISNDISYDEIFRLQLKSHARRNDLLIMFSVSGNSKNIINAAKYAKLKKLKTISIVGFKNSKIKKMSNICIELDNYNFGVSEDIFQIIMHCISQFIRQKNFSKSKITRKYF